MESESRPLVAGEASGEAIVLEEPLSLWGGLDPDTGVVIDRRHPQVGASVTDRIMVMPHGRGSSSSSAVMAEAIRLGTSPAAVIMAEPDAIVMLGSVVADELYGRACPVVVVDQATYDRLATGQQVDISATGRLTIHD